jgi:hypothetical protein
MDQRFAEKLAGKEGDESFDHGAECQAGTPRMQRAKKSPGRM